MTKQGFVLMWTHKLSREKGFIGIIMKDWDGETEKGTPVHEGHCEMFNTLAEASQHPFPTADSAAAIVGSLGETVNTIYTVVPAGE